jgi:hypothetical protein
MRRLNDGALTPRRHALQVYIGGNEKECAHCRRKVKEPIVPEADLFEAGQLLDESSIKRPKRRPGGAA